MQVTQESESRRVGVAENLIKFRPSPNFLNMKRFLKKKIVDASVTVDTGAKISALCGPNDLPVKSDAAPQTVTQPPLPRGPPPPDSPPLIINIKKEIEDDDSTSSSFSDGARNFEETKNTNKKVCRDFIRGQCTRSICRYAHEINTSQLRGVYTFCRDYQNSVCFDRLCKYVHATIFEKEEFFRTGVLPAACLSPTRKMGGILQPPPPPPPPPPEEVVPEVPVHFSQPPPVPVSLVPSVHETRPPLAELRAALSNAPDLSRSLRDLHANEATKKQCCELAEVRLSMHRRRVEMMHASLSATNKYIEELDAKRARLVTILMMLSKKLPAAGVNGGSPAAHFNDKPILARLHALVNPGARRSEDVVKNNTASSNPLSQLLRTLSSGDADAARDS